MLGLAPGDATGPGPEPASPEAEAEYTQKLQLIFNRAIDQLGDDHAAQLGKQVLEDLKAAAYVLAGIAVAAGALVAGAAVVSGGAAIPVAIGALASAAAAVGARALWAVGLQGVVFLYDVINIALDATKVDRCDDAGRDALGDRLAKRIIETEAGLLEDVATFGVGRLARKLSDVFSGLKGAKTCSFAGDTLVLTQTGLVAIREIDAANDNVWARDEQTGEMNWKPVLAHYANPYEETVSVTLRHSTGAEQTIVSNAIHPYFARVPAGASIAASSEGPVYAGNIDNGAWIDAANLQPGYELLSNNETWQAVVAVEVKAQPLNAFNLTVKDYSTYFVAANDEADAVWVHNKCYDTLPEGSRRTGTNELGQETYVTRDGRAIYQGDDRRYYDIAPKPKIISNRSDFDDRFDPSSFPSQAHADDAWSAYRATSTDTRPIVLGRLPDTEAGEALGFQRLNVRNWSPQVNNAWTQGGIDAERNFYLGSNANISNYRAAGIFDSKGNFLGRGEFPDTVFFSEMRQLRDAGYRLDGNYMRPAILK